MRVPVAAVAFAVLMPWLALSALTAAGARRRKQRWPYAFVTGLLFPLTWVAWYLADERHPGKAPGSLSRPDSEEPESDYSG
jgi:hypothetical protein